MDWVYSNWASICESLLAAYGLACLVVKLTPSKKDDKILEMLTPALDKLEAISKKVETSNNNGTGDS